MPDLIVIFGPPASGKAAVGHELAKRTGFRLFHNHLTAEPVGALFGWGTPLFGEVASEMRLQLLSRALEQPDMPSIIFTFVWAFDVVEDNRFMSRLVDLFASAGRRVSFVELLASREAREAREGTPLRLALKPSKHDVERARALHAQLDGKYQMNSRGAFPYPARHLIIDTERHTAAESARVIDEHFSLS